MTITLTADEKLKAKRKKDREAISASGQGQLQRPKWTEAFKSFQSFREADTGNDKAIKVTLITEGPGNLRDRNYYTRDAIEDAAQRKTFEGVRCYLNHQSPEEREANPVNRVENLAGYYRNTHFEMVEGADGIVRAGICGELIPDASKAGQELLAKARASAKFRQQYPASEEVYAGLSINGGGNIDGKLNVQGEEWNRIARFEGIESVDAVTRPARGGEFQAILESFQPPLAGANMRIRELKRKLRRTEEALKTEKDPAKIVKLNEDATDLKKHLVSKVMGQPDAEKAPEDEEEGDDAPPADDKDPKAVPAEDEAEDEAEAKGIEALKSFIPKKEEEDEAGYHERLKAAMCAARGESEEEAEKEEEGKKPMESMSAEDLKAQFPKLYEAAFVAGKAVAESKETDFKVLRKQLKEAQEKVTRLESEKKFLESFALAKKLIKEAGLNENVMPLALLAGKDEGVMRAEIESRLALIESVAPGMGGFAPNRAGSGAGASDVKTFVEACKPPAEE